MLLSKPSLSRIVNQPYSTGLVIVALLQAAESDAILPVCRTRALLHGQPTAQAVILVHGLTNCPQQWAPFADLLFAAGCNVLLARMPRQRKAAAEPRGSVAARHIPAGFRPNCRFRTLRPSIRG